MRHIKLQYEGQQRQNASTKELLILLTRKEGNTQLLPDPLVLGEPHQILNCKYVLTNENGQHITSLKPVRPARGLRGYYLGDITTRPVNGMINSTHRTILVRYINNDGKAKVTIWIHPAKAKNKRNWVDDVLKIRNVRRT